MVTTTSKLGTGNEAGSKGAPSATTCRVQEPLNANQNLTKSNARTGFGNDVDRQHSREISLNGGASPHTFDVSGGFTGAVTLTSVNGNDAVASTADTDFTLNNGRLSESNGANIDLVNITTANLTVLSP